jgi:MacB-like periplasmic core domain
MTSSLLIGPGYFGALGVRGLRGREFTAADGVQGRNVVIVNEQFVSRYFHKNDPIGRRIRVTDRDESTPEREWLTIVGIAPNVRQRPTEDDLHHRGGTTDRGRARRLSHSRPSCHASRSGRGAAE